MENSLENITVRPPEFAKEVWDVLSNVDVKKMIKTENKVEFITWSQIWRTIMGIYPNSRHEFWVERMQSVGDDGPCETVETYCSLTISDGDHSLTRVGHLPVMHFGGRFRSVENPTSREISDSKWRCLVKTAALFGLGLELWSAAAEGGQGTNPEQKIMDHAKLKSDYRMNLWAAAIVIKGAFVEEVPSVAVEAYVELSDEEKGWLLLAETKGGYLTQAEKSWLKEQHYLEYKADE